MIAESELYDGFRVYTFNGKQYGNIEALLSVMKWHKFSVLNDGFVCLVDIMGDDDAVVQAARVSYGLASGHERMENRLKKMYPNGGESDYYSSSGAIDWSREQYRAARLAEEADDKRLLRYLMRHRHTTPSEMVEFKFLVRVPMDCWRQWVRHRAASINEYSTRYSPAIDSCQVTRPDEWRVQAKTNNQGSDGFLEEWPEIGTEIKDITGCYPSLKQCPGEFLTDEEEQLHALCRSVYNTRIQMGVAREQARKDLPLSTYTEAYWKIDLHNLLHFLALRMDSHAQWEIRQYANAIGQIVATTLPDTWEAFCDYRLNSLSLTALDIDVVQRLSKHGTPVSHDTFMANGHGSWMGLTKCREREECLEKLVRLGIVDLSL